MTLRSSTPILDCLLVAAVVFVCGMVVVVDEIVVAVDDIGDVVVLEIFGKF